MILYTVSYVGSAQLAKVQEILRRTLPVRALSSKACIDSPGQLAAVFSIAQPVSMTLAKLFDPAWTGLVCRLRRLFG